MNERGSEYNQNKFPDISAEILRSAISGEEEARTQLCNFFKDDLVHYFIRGGIPADEIPDCSQDTWEKLLKRLPYFKVKPDKSFRGYLFKIAQTAKVDYYRTTYEHSGFLVTQFRLHAKHPFPSPEEAYELKEICEAINDQLQKIPEQQAIAFYHHVIEGDQHEVSAQLMGTTEVYARQLTSRGQGKIKQVLTATGLH